MSVLFEFKNADISISSKIILSNINWSIKRGQHCWINGLNGSGKTTLCKAISGRCRISKGKAATVGLNYSDIKMISFTDDGKLFHSVNNVHYYQQRFNSWDADGHMTCRDYLHAQGIDQIKIANSEFIKEIGLHPLLDIERIKLSSGQTRKLLLTSALLHNPSLLILDNPYIGLDKESRSYLNDFLDFLASEHNITIILSGQATSLPKCITQKLSLQDGKLLKHANSSLNDKTTTKIDKFLLEKIKNYNFNNRDVNAEDSILQLKNIRITYKDLVILSLNEWTVDRGERWALFGKNGSGKSTLVSLIYADHPQVYSQDISIFGRRPGPGRSIWDIKKNIGFTSPELHAYFRTDMSARDVILSGLFDKLELFEHCTEGEIEWCTNLMKYFDIEHLQFVPYRELSTGLQRLCLFLRSLIKCPRLYLLDEPFQGLDSENIALARQLLDELLCADQTLIFISHFENELPETISNFINL